MTIPVIVRDAVRLARSNIICLHPDLNSRVICSYSGLALSVRYQLVTRFCGLHNGHYAAIFSYISRLNAQRVISPRKHEGGVVGYPRRFSAGPIPHYRVLSLCVRGQSLLGFLGHRFRSPFGFAVSRGTHAVLSQGCASGYSPGPGVFCE